ncbi:2'-5'-oligoadenylate synthetase 2 [Pteropus alecto]|uniref:2'-5'-oligoadenylate synthetase 2 n=1 Tax=Pteropus alecto TaxID=9402 RepID=L5KXF5_PTEAL|nr:2'-5'-oligoadenylate synthetase 2 [Pteropus alecto]
MGTYRLYQILAQELGTFIQRSLRPSEDCQRRIDEAVETICAALQEAKEHPLVTSVAKGGSYGRKTVLRGNSDGTLVIFVSDFVQFKDQKQSQREILSRIWDRLKARQIGRRLAVAVETQRPSGRLTIQLSTEWQSILFEVLPAFNVLGLSEKPSSWIYRELKRSLDMTKASPGEFSVCFTKLQQNFFNNRPRKLKDLILLVKYWHQQCQKKLKDPSLPPSYALELLTVYAWEQGCGAEAFDIVEGIKMVLELITQWKHLCVYWTVNYNFEDETVRNIILGQIRSPRPVILDPTDPTNNISKDKACWELLNGEAQVWLNYLSSNESPGPSWNVLPAPLSETPGHLLDKFIKDFLQPNKTFLDQLHKAVDTICTFLKENCFRHSTIKVQKTVQGGSAGKGTALKTGSDADLVVFPSSIKSFASQITERTSIINEIRAQLAACQREKKFEVKFEMSKWKAPRVLSFSLKSKELNESVDFDVLPAFNVLGQLESGSKPSPRVYTELISLYKSPNALRGEFSTCFTELQRDFVLSRPTKLKDLIRLVKYWYKQCERKLKTKGSLPPKYALELLTIYAWEQGSGVEDFDTAEGFRTVLELVTRYHQLSEPTGDVGGGDRWCWNLLAKEATEWLFSLCFKDGAGNLVRLWKVPTVQIPGSRGARMHPTVNEMFSFRSRGLLE